MAAMRISVTGANGFVGAALCRTLAAKGHHVRGLVRRTSDLSLLSGVELEIFYGSLDDESSLDAATRGRELVYHAAAAVTDWGAPEYFRNVNVEGTGRLLDICVRNGVRRIVYISSVAVHSFTGGRNLDEEAPQYPTRFYYSQSKREAEALVRSYQETGKLETVIIRPGDIYGPGDRVTMMRLAPLLDRGLLVLIDRGARLGAFTYIENLVNALVLAGCHQHAAGETFVIVDDVSMTWREFFCRLTEALELPGPWVSIPGKLAAMVAFVLEKIYHMIRIQSRPPITRYLVDHLTHDVHFTIDKARRILEFRPAIGTDEAMRRTAEWYHMQKRVRAGKTDQTRDTLSRHD